MIGINFECVIEINFECENGINFESMTVIFNVWLELILSVRLELILLYPMMQCGHIFHHFPTSQSAVQCSSPSSSRSAFFT